MDFEQSVEDWKAHDQWEFADKEAAWGFFFMAGRESKQRGKEMDPHIDGVVPDQFEANVNGFLVGMLIGNLRRIHAAYDDEGEDLSALPAEAADKIERFLGLVAEMIAHCEERAKGWNESNGKDRGDCKFGARHEARAIAAQLREIAGRVLTPNAN